MSNLLKTSSVVITSLLKNCLPASLFKKGLIENLLGKYLIASLFKKDLIENMATFEFEDLIPKPYRRDKPEQRLRPNNCGVALVIKRADL